MRHVMFIVAVVVIACGPARTMWAQSGSTGGTIGKQGKSVSGGESEPERRPKAATGQPQRRAPEATARPTPSRVFDNPTIAGKRVDRCLQYGFGCDQPAANIWCRSKGFTSATNWKTESVSPTYIQGDGQTCSFLCGGFSQITCE
jgi:hypothetical protein